MKSIARHKRGSRPVMASPWAVCALLAALVAFPAYAQQTGEGGREVVLIQATGYGAHYPNDLARSREEALEAAFRDAVEQASGVFISTATETRNFELVRDEVLTRSEGFVRRYEVVREGLGGEVYTIVIDAEVEKAAFIDDMNAALQLLYSRVGKPRVMVVVKENNAFGAGGTLDRLSVAEKEIRKILLQQGFQFIDARTLGGQSILDAAVAGDTLQREAVVNFARGTEADLVILGAAQTKSMGMIRRFHSIQANISLDVVRVDSGQVMASESLAANGVHVDEATAGMTALKKAAGIVTPMLMEQVTYLWVKERNEGARIEIVVQNISFGDLIEFRKVLGNSVRGVKQVTQRSYADGVALLEVRARTNAESLAEAIYQTRFEAFQVDIQNLSNNRVTVTITAR